MIRDESSTRRELEVTAAPVAGPTHRRHRAVEIFGLMRSSELRKTPLEGSYARGDSVLIVRMALLGRYVELEPRLFLSRSHPSQSMQQLPSRLKDVRGRVEHIGLRTTSIRTEAGTRVTIPNGQLADSWIESDLAPAVQQARDLAG